MPNEPLSDVICPEQLGIEEQGLPLLSEWDMRRSLADGSRELARTAVSFGRTVNLRVLVAEDGTLLAATASLSAISDSWFGEITDVF